ncbi:GNAT family N-acetyltransferase [Ovoidimarina sediminis]|uniref:GNAT family N-acetyltransferase n=1 Tax=Ovoidimarina sediminis TaxID=3079856 RepID=UPI002910F129|nr:GNAT family N-acetyltransferase [Rhodophyticola sp. MJ-SS7]MDU8944961.1 GNAT family N-acetyltransferase [Rhodophyticola sp. MJ-SS7]
MSDHAYISTPRLRLTPVGDGDPVEVAEAIGNYDVARWLGRVPYPYRPADAEAFMAANAHLVGKVWFIYDREGLVGGIGIDGELGYWLARTAWGQGYATEACDAVLDAHFSDPAAESLLSGHYPGNHRSATVLRKLGFVYTGRRPVQAQALAQTVEGHELLLTRDAWEARRNILIRTERLTLRPLRDADWRQMQKLGGVPEVARMMLMLTVPWPEAAVRQWIATSAFRGRPGYRLAVERNDGGLIGSVGFGPDHSLNYMIDRRFWGRGYASEAVRAFLADLFARFPEIDVIEADHFADNPASGAVLRKLGFEKTGTGLGASKARVERAPNVLYRLSREAFRTAP